MAEQWWRNNQNAAELDRKANDTMLRRMKITEFITNKREKIEIEVS
jgi:hypothetical protein